MSKNSSIKIRRALLSVSDKTGIVELAKFLQKENVEIISDLKAYNADQEKSMERGKELLKAFEDD